MLFTVMAIILGSLYGAYALFRIQATLPIWARVLTWIVIVILALIGFGGVACVGLATFGNIPRF